MASTVARRRVIAGRARIRGEAVKAGHAKVVAATYDRATGAVEFFQ